MNQYTFDITIKLTDIGIEADSEEEARLGLTERLGEYFNATDVSISEDEAKLVGIIDENGNRVTEE